MNSVIRGLLLSAMCLSTAACAGGHGTRGVVASTPSTRRLDPTIPGWIPANRARIDAFLETRGVTSPHYDPSHRPVAVFDWDNTMMRNDIGDATMAYALRHDGFQQPPARDWTVTSAALTDSARASLHAACDAAGEPGQPLATSRVTACADEIFAIYTDGHTVAGAPGWTHEISLTTHEAYAWLARLLAGHTSDEVRSMARAAFDENSNAAIGATQTVGHRDDVTAWVRIYPTMHDLVGTLQANGFDTWIVSASPQYLSEVVASHVGIDANHVIGVRTVYDHDGRLAYDLESCGTAPANTLITFNQGKRCFINRVIFGLPVNAQLGRADISHRPAFAAGDSDTDVAFVQDATDLKLVINRNRVQLSCNAYSDTTHRWLVQPMFIRPLPHRPEPYPCSTALDAAGARITDEAGATMTDQIDSVFALPSTN